MPKLNSENIQKYYDYTAWLLIGSYFIALFIVNYIVAYPTDNDLDDVGWIIANLSWDRGESLANNSYPVGLPVLLKLVSPLLGGVLPAALLIASIATSIVVLLIYRLSRFCFEQPGVGLIAIVLAIPILFEAGTSEFADATCTMFLFLGGYLLLVNQANIRGFFFLGLCIGAAYLFRYHYMSLLPVVGLLSILFPGILLERTLRIAAFVLGMFLVASPQLTFNLMDHGSLLSHPYQSYVNGIFIHGELDFGRFLETYDNWPLSRVIAETTFMEYFSHVTDKLHDILKLPSIGLALIGLPITLGLAKGLVQKHFLVFLFLTVALYVAIIVVPSRYTYRSMIPTFAVAAMYLAPLLYLAFDKLKSRYRLFLFLPLLIGFMYSITPINQGIDYIEDKHSNRTRNLKLLDELETHGMKTTQEVFTNYSNFFPLTDPAFITMHKQGSWMRLDSKFNKEYPDINQIVGLDAWESHFRSRGIRFAVLRKGRIHYQDFYSSRLKAPWKRVYSDRKFVIVKLLNR